VEDSFKKARGIVGHPDPRQNPHHTNTSNICNDAHAQGGLPTGD